MTILQEIESGVLSAVIAESNANQATIEAWLASGEADVQTTLAGLIKKIPSVTGPAGLVANPIIAAVERGIEAYVASYIAQQPPSKVFAAYIALLTRLQSLA